MLLDSSEAFVEHHFLVVERQSVDTIRQLNANQRVHGHVDLDSQVESGDEGDRAFWLFEDMVGEDVLVIYLDGELRVWLGEGRRENDNVSLWSSELYHGPGESQH